MQKIGIFFGGESPEYAVSLRSAAAVLSHIDREKYEPIAIGLTRSGGFYYTRALPAAIERDEWLAGAVPCRLLLREEGRGIALDDGTRLPLDLIFPLLHGGAGEDGRLSALFSLSGLPYLASPCEGAALAMNKGAAKLLAREAGVPVLPHFTTHGADLVACKAQAAALGYPLFCKPLHGGSSVGAGIVPNEAALETALARATAGGDLAMLEPYLRAREIEIALIEERGTLVLSPVGEVLYTGDFYDYDCKYNSPQTRLSLAALSPVQNTRVRTYAEKVFRALGLARYARLDFFLAESGEIFFNEANTLPGFTAGSMFPFLFGGDLRALSTRLALAALAP